MEGEEICYLGGYLDNLSESGQRPFVAASVGEIETGCIYSRISKDCLGRQPIAFLELNDIAFDRRSHNRVTFSHRILIVGILILVLRIEYVSMAICSSVTLT